MQKMKKERKIFCKFFAMYSENMAGIAKIIRIAMISWQIFLQNMQLIEEFCSEFLISQEKYCC